MSEVKTERPRTAGRIAPTGRVTPSVHQSAGNGRRKAIPVPPPRVPTPMPSANNNQQRRELRIFDFSYVCISRIMVYKGLPKWAWDHTRSPQALLAIHNDGKLPSLSAVSLGITPASKSTWTNICVGG
ncbi:hypothetical protein HZH66_004607 [Vespula vulgaris]|uniref:Uncharacterized protein n=1 Tax=Vespula vulgaris TaxID=7454 RepID=A0A834K9E3_VESVU|nr:hypothetical protein HZH66_004607 [Vespula vulgaris]